MAFFQEVWRQAQIFPSAVVLVAIALFYYFRITRRRDWRRLGEWAVLWFVVLVIYAILAPAMFAAGYMARTTTTHRVMKARAIAIALYASDWGDRYPLSTNWREASNQYQTLDSDYRTRWDIAYNAELAATRYEDWPGMPWLLVTVVDAGADGLVRDPSRVRLENDPERGRGAWANADGKTRTASPEKLRALIAHPRSNADRIDYDGRFKSEEEMR